MRRLPLLLWIVCCAAALRKAACTPSSERMRIQSVIDKTPCGPDLSKLVEPIPWVGRRLRLASPCIGIHGCKFALEAMGAPTDTCLGYDLVAGYRSCLVQELIEMGMDMVNINEHLHLGPEDGDILCVDFTYLASLHIDLLVCGPPCPPWASCGSHKHMKDPKARIFMRIIIWILVLSHCSGLLCVVVENVTGVLASYDGIEPAMDKFLRLLRLFVPSFVWRVDTLDLRQYLHPQSRKRTFLRGLRSIVAKIVPSPLAPLVNFLGNFRHTPRSTFSRQQQLNIQCYERKICDQVARGCLYETDIVIIAPDRQEGLGWGQSMSINCAPTWTTQNDDLMILSVGDVVHQVPDGDRRFFRKFTPTERLTLQSFPASLAFYLGESLTGFATGNAYPPVLILATLYPLIKAISSSDLDLASWPETTAAVPWQAIRRMQRYLVARGRIVDKEKHAAAKTKAKRRKRGRASSDSN